MYKSDSTTGVQFAPDRLSTVVPPGSYHTVQLRGTPLEAGILVIRGCWVRLAGCAAREFLLPVWNSTEEAARQKTELLNAQNRIKLTGLHGRPGHRAEIESPYDVKELTFIECTVVSELPMLWMRSTSLTHGALMLYDGEVYVMTKPRSKWTPRICTNVPQLALDSTRIRLVLQNTSRLPVDFMKLSFQDSHTQAAESLVAESELSATDAYEIQSDIQHRPVFRWEPKTTLAIEPGHHRVLEVECLGKVCW